MKLTAIALFLVCSAVLSPAAHQHYLPSVGPNPLRLGPAIPPSLPADILPAMPETVAPSVSTVEPPPVAAPTPPSTASTAQPAPTPATSAPVASPASEPRVPTPPLAVLPGEESKAITPQMLLHYFHPVDGTNSTFVSLPVLFTPPVPASDQASSRATYSTPPGPVSGPGTPPAAAH